MNKKQDTQEIDVDFNEALRRIAHTPKQLIDEEKINNVVPPPISSDDTKIKAASS